jgi:glycine hydroxymethyltransferase
MNSSLNDPSQVRKVPAGLTQVRNLVHQHEAWRAETLNLIASENVLSPAVRAALDNDWLGRYADYTGRDLTARRYRGTRYIGVLEQMVESLAKELFRADYVECRPLAGHLAGAAVISGLCKPGDVVLEVGPEGGSHREASKLSGPSLLPLKVSFLPFDGLRFNIDIPQATRMIEETRPRMVILGSSTFLFPHPVREIKDALQRVNPQGILVYDASHVMGFVASRRFQAPLSEGADIVFGSLHKTFPGPQGGIIFTNRQDLIIPASEAIYPAFVTNHHPFRMPALATALLEMKDFGPAYTGQIITNAQCLGTELDELGLECVRVDGRYSRSHTVLLKVEKFGEREELARLLESADIITTACTLPKEQGSQGIRLGVQELTRRGAGEPEMKETARLICQVLLQKQPAAEIAKHVHTLTARLGSVQYTWSE